MAEEKLELWVGPQLPDDHETMWRRRHRIEAALEEDFADSIFNESRIYVPGLGDLTVECLEDDPDLDSDTIVLVYEGVRYEVEIMVNLSTLPPLKLPAEDDEESREPGPGQLALSVD